MSHLPFLASLPIVLLTELGDKTQLIVIALSTRYGRLAVFSGSLLAVCLVDGLGILAGTASGTILPGKIPSLLASFLFLTFGFWILLRKEEGERPKAGGSAFLSSFLLISLMEVGDKTQLSTFALSVEYREPLWILLGTMVAYSLLMGVGVTIGSYLGRRLPERILRKASAALFLLLGFLLLLRTLG
ncbi:MAG: TMEM165/GDT1 family protein [Candidatus Hadarchaeales archaeon]